MNSDLLLRGNVHFYELKDVLYAKEERNTMKLFRHHLLSKCNAKDIYFEKTSRIRQASSDYNRIFR